MSERITIDLPTIPTFSSGVEVEEVLKKRDKGETVSTYWRDGTAPEIVELEATYASFVGVAEGNLRIYNSGMAAIRDAIDVVDPTADDLVLCAQDLYEKSHDIFAKLEKKRVKVVKFPSGSPDSIEAVLKDSKPKAVFAETVANAGDMPVLDVERLLTYLDLGTTLLVLDNTLPTPSVWPVVKHAKEDDLFLIVESGTKSYALNKDLMGITYSNNAGLMRELWRNRRTFGSTLSAATTALATKLVSGSKEDFDHRNRRIVANTLILAQRLAENADSSKFKIMHPNIVGRPNYDYVSERFPNGCTSTFWIYCLDSDRAQFELLDMLSKNQIIRDLTVFSQSFGFSKTRIWAYLGNDARARISAGEESLGVIEELGEELGRILSGI